MSVQHLLEDFGDLDAEQLVMTDQALEEERLASFERGYQAGWEDASKAHAQEQGHIGGELARNLQDLSFTFHEAQAAILNNLEPLFQHLLHTVLPAVAQDGFETRIVEELGALSRELGGGCVIVSVAPAHTDRVEALLGDMTTLDVSVQPDGTLGEGQAFLRLGQRERMIDLKTALDEIQQRISAFFEASKEAQNHG